MAKIMRQTLREQVTQAIRMKLLTGELKSGTKIVEQEMAEELGVSRGPVREALRQIEQEGLVEYTSHVGCSVKDFTAQDVYEVYLLRANLETLFVTIKSMRPSSASDTMLLKPSRFLYCSLKYPHPHICRQISNRHGFLCSSCSNLPVPHSSMPDLHDRWTPVRMLRFSAF